MVDTKSNAQWINMIERTDKYALRMSPFNDVENLRWIVSHSERKCAVMKEKELKRFITIIIWHWNQFHSFVFPNSIKSEKHKEKRNTRADSNPKVRKRRKTIVIIKFIINKTTVFSTQSFPHCQSEICWFLCPFFLQPLFWFDHEVVQFIWNQF